MRPTLFEFAGGEAMRALDDAELPTEPAFREALRAYMEWAVATVLSYSALDAVVPAGVRMPRWDWDGLQT